jgi:hypothetical protein
MSAINIRKRRIHVLQALQAIVAHQPVCCPGIELYELEAQSQRLRLRRCGVWFGVMMVELCVAIVEADE